MWVQNYHRLLAYFRRKALPGFSQLYRIHLMKPFNNPNWSAARLRVSDEEQDRFIEGTQRTRYLKIFYPEGLAKQFYGPGY